MRYTSLIEKGHEVCHCEDCTLTYSEAGFRRESASTAESEHDARQKLTAAETVSQLATLKRIAKHRMLRQQVQLDDLLNKLAEVAAVIAVDELMAGDLVLVNAAPNAPDQRIDLTKRKRMLASTKGIWKERGIDGFEYRVTERAEW